MSEYIVKGAEPNKTVLHRRTANGYDGWSWLPVREEIVRCSDCRYWVEDPHPIDPWWPMMCDDSGRDMVGPDGFCAWGERKDGDDD